MNNLRLISELGAHRELATVSSLYLQLDCFKPTSTTDVLKLAVLNGDLRLRDYVYSNWVHHIIKSRSPDQYNPVIPDPLNNVLRDVVECCFTDTAQGSIWEYIESLWQSPPETTGM